MMKKITFIKRFLNKQKPKIILICIISAGFGNVYSQNVVLTSGGTINGISGSASFSIGQTIASTLASNDGSAIQGIQFYFDDSTLEIIDVKTNLNLAVYPNPVVSILHLVSDYRPHTLVYDIVDITGKQIIKGQIVDTSTRISLDQYESAVYFLKVYNKESRVTKTFKIIKK